MLIEKTTLIEFDDVAERARIVMNYHGEKRQALLSVVHAMAAGDWVELVRLFVALPASVTNCLSPPIIDLVAELNERDNRRVAFDAGYANAAFRRSEWSLTAGFASGPESADYPKLALRQVDDAPAAASAPVPPHMLPVRAVRFMPAEEVTVAERAYVRRSDLCECGDAILVWANEGDLNFHKRFPSPEPAIVLPGCRR